MTTSEILEAANKLVNGDRRQDYGDARESFARVADLWGAYLDTKITPHAVAVMMVLFKASRTCTGVKDDTYIDMAGYAALAGWLATHKERHGDAKEAPE